MHTVRISVIFCYIYFVFGITEFSYFSRQYVIDFQCDLTKISFVKNVSNGAVSCVKFCGMKQDCLSVYYNNVTRQCVGCESYVSTGTSGNSNILVYEKQGLYK